MQCQMIHHQQRVDGGVVRVDKVGEKITTKVRGAEETVGGGEETMRQCWNTRQEADGIVKKNNQETNDGKQFVDTK